MKRLTASQLRQNIYRILDQIVETGEEVTIERNGATLLIVPASRSMRKLSKLRKNKLTDEDSSNFEHIDWTQEWKENK